MIPRVQPVTYSGFHSLSLWHFCTQFDPIFAQYIFFWSVAIISGYLFDYTGDPNAPFFLFDTIQVAGGVLVSAIPGVKKYIKPHIMDGPEAKEIESHHSNTSTVWLLYPRKGPTGHFF